jgi:PilZ domain
MRESPFGMVPYFSFFLRPHFSEDGVLNRHIVRHFFSCATSSVSLLRAFAVPEAPGNRWARPLYRRTWVRLYLGNLNTRRKEKMMDGMLVPHKTRRWPRVPVDLPVRVVTAKGFSTTVVPGRGTELSEGGMVLYAGILLSPGDLLEVEFDMPSRSHLTAIVRSKNGFCFGLEFLAPLPD